jgi:hypothetical protein
MRDLRPGEFHWRDGVIFAQANALGDVRVAVFADATLEGVPLREVIIPAAEWESIILHCARSASDPLAARPSIDDAQAFHRGRR